MKFETEIEIDEDTLADMIWTMTLDEILVVLEEIGERFNMDFSAAAKTIKTAKNNGYVSDFY